MLEETRMLSVNQTAAQIKLLEMWKTWKTTQSKWTKEGPLLGTGQHAVYKPQSTKSLAGPKSAKKVLQEMPQSFGTKPQQHKKCKVNLQY
jgi:hypothetical protein